MTSSTGLPSSHEPKPLAVVGDVLRILLHGASTEGRSALIEETTPPGGGPPPHVHRDEDETFYVLEGDVDFLLGNVWTRVPPGGTAWGPRGVPHTFRNVGSTPSRVLTVITPAGFERFFEEVDRLSQSGPPSPEQLVALGERYGLSILPPQD